MKTPYAKDIYAFDIENDMKVLTCGSIVGQDFEKQFNTKEEFWEIVKGRGFRNRILYATNLEYDLGFLMDGLKEERDIELFKRGGRLIFARMKSSGKNSVTFADTMNFSPCGVEALGKMLGMPKMAKPSFSPQNEDEWKYLREYNLNDARISFNFMKMLEAAIISLGGRMKITASATSLQLFRDKYYDFMMKPSKFSEIEMEAYFGGRTEVFRRGSFKQVNVYDINSMYPHVMASNPFPKAETAKRGYDPKLQYEGISYCNIYCPKDILIPLLPIRHHGKVIFPTGTFTGWYCHPELRKAKELGYDIKVIKSIIYETDYMFKGFMNDMYLKRLQYKDNDIMKTAIKLMMNSLYGKFAISDDVQKEKHISEMTTEDIIDMLNDNKKIDTRGFICYDEKMDKEPRYRQPIISAYVTSYARLLLYGYFEQLKGNVIYCDTDSVFTTSEISTSEKLGDMKLEYNGEAVIIKPKMYIIKTEQFTKIKVKGLGRAVKDEQMFRDYIMKDKPITFTRFAKIREARRRGLWYCQPIECFKQMGLEDDKRRWQGQFNPEVSEISIPIHISQ